MPDDGRQFDTADKAAALLLGTPLLAGVILVVLAFGSPGSAPYRDRQTIAPIAVGLIVLGVVGGALYVRWRLRRQRAASLDDMAANGAIRLPKQRRTPRLIQISHALAEQFLLPPASCSLPYAQPTVTAGQVSDAVYTAVRALEDRGQMPFDPESINLAAFLVLDFVKAGSGKLGMTTDLNRAVPMRDRRKVVRSFRDRAAVHVPLTLPKWALALGSLLAVAATFAITVPLAQGLDRTVSIDTEDSVTRLMARFIVRGGFFGILILFTFALVFLFRLLFPAFPDRCRTIGHLAARLPRQHTPDAETRWTREQIWAEVRRIIATPLNLDEAQVRFNTPCG